MSLRPIETRKADKEIRRIHEMDKEDFEWLSERAKEFEERYKGRCIAVVNKELFVGESIDEVIGLAKSKYPEREPFVEFVPIKRRVLVV